MKILVFGIISCTLTVLLTLNPSSYSYEKINVSSMGLELSEGTSGEPFGYFHGSWNLWEFIGDSISSLLTGF